MFNPQALMLIFILGFSSLIAILPSTELSSSSWLLYPTYHNSPHHAVIGMQDTPSQTEPPRDLNTDIFYLALLMLALFAGGVLYVFFGDPSRNRWAD